MALSIIGEIVTLVEQGWNIWQSCQNAKGAIGDAGRVVLKAQARIGILKSQIVKNTHLDKASAEYLFLIDTLKGVRSGIRELSTILGQGGFKKYKAWFFSDIDGLVSKIEGHIGDINDILDDLSRGLHDEVAWLQAEAMAKAKTQIMNEREAKFRAQSQTHVDSQRLLMQLYSVEGQASIEAAARSTDPAEWAELEKALMNMDDNLSRRQARQLLKPIKDYIIHTVPQGSLAINPGKQVPRPHSPNPPGSHPQAHPLNTAKNSKNGLPVKQIGSILCVDFSNTFRTLMAQYQLEYAKLKTLNASSHWLFDSVDSAGVAVQSDFMERAVAAAIFSSNNDYDEVERTRLGVPDLANLKVLRSADEDRRTALIKFIDDTRPTPKATEIHDAVSLLHGKKQGLELRHFREIDHILCFGADTYRILRQARVYAKSQLGPSDPPLKGWITNLKVGAPQLPGAPPPSDAKLSECFDQVRKNVHAWLEATLNWENPEAWIHRLPLRSREFIIPLEKMAKVTQCCAQLQHESGCKSLVIKQFRPDAALVTATAVPGSKEGLKRLKELIESM